MAEAVGDSRPRVTFIPKGCMGRILSDALNWIQSNPLAEPILRYHAACSTCMTVVDMDQLVEPESVTSLGPGRYSTPESGNTPAPGMDSRIN